MWRNLTGVGVMAATIALASSAHAQAPKPWSLGVIEPKGDAGFSADGEPARLRRETRPQGQDRADRQRHARPQGAARRRDRQHRVHRRARRSWRGCAAPISRSWAATGRACCTASLPRRASPASPTSRASGSRSRRPDSLPDLVGRAIFQKYNVDFASLKTASLGNDLDRYKALLAGVVDFDHHRRGADGDRAGRYQSARGRP